MTQRTALLVATAQYDDPELRRLRAPAQDAEALADVLRNPQLGNFAEVRTLIERPRQEIEEAIEDTFSDRRPTDLVLLYFSCHGVKDARGRLHFATSATRRDRLASTAVSSVFVNEQLEHSRAGAKVALLDCCYSGAFVKGLAPKGALTGDLASQVCGRGSYVITASNALEYAYEGGDLTLSRGAQSLFTRAIVEGLRSGAADRDGDGWVSAEDLYWHVADTLGGHGTQTPTSFSSGVQGPVHLARAHREASPTATGAAAANLSAVTRRLRDLEVRYASIREVLPSGSNRTSRLDEIVWEAKTIGPSAERHGELERRAAAFRTDTDEARVITLGLLQGARRSAAGTVSCALDGITASRSAFEQFHALLAAEAMLDELDSVDRDRIVGAVRSALESDLVPSHGNRAATARHILNRVTPPLPAPTATDNTI